MTVTNIAIHSGPTPHVGIKAYSLFSLIVILLDQYKSSGLLQNIDYIIIHIPVYTMQVIHNHNGKPSGLHISCV